MSFTLVLNSSNVSNTSTNTSFKYNFINGGFKIKDMEMCVSSITIPYSFIMFLLITITKRSVLFFQLPQQQQLFLLHSQKDFIQ